MKKVLIFTIFGPLIGALSIVLFISILGVFSEKNSGNLSGVFFFMFLFCHWYGAIPALLTGGVSIKLNKFNLKDTSILVLFAILVTCLFHYFILHREFQDLPDVSVLPSAVSTFVLSYLLRTNKPIAGK